MEKYKNYLVDNIGLVLEKIDELNSEQDSNDAFLIGKRTAYYDIITIFKEQAELFDIDLREIGLENLNENNIL
jgi:hypothetical protein